MFIEAGELLGDDCTVFYKGPVEVVVSSGINLKSVQVIKLSSRTAHSKALSTRKKNHVSRKSGYGSLGKEVAYG